MIREEKWGLGNVAVGNASGFGCGMGVCLI